MKTLELTVYTIKELKELFPSAYQHKLSQFQNDHSDIAWLYEINESMKALLCHCNVKAKWFRDNDLRLHEFQAEGLKGKRAMAWLENTVKGPLRKGFTIPSYRYKSEKKHKAKKPYTLADCVPDCPLTGYCFDYTLLEELEKAIRKGETVKQAIEGLSYFYQKEIDNEIEQQTSEENFLEVYTDYNFDDKGRIV